MIRLLALPLLGLSFTAPAVAAGQPATSAASSQAEADAPDLTGDWRGALDIGQTLLRLVVHFSDEDGDGSWAGTMDSIDQGAGGFPLSNIEVSGEALSFDIESIGGRYKAVWQEGEWVGTWSQAGNEIPLTFARGPFETAAAKPTIPDQWDLPDQAAVAQRLAEAIGDREGVVGTVALVDADGPRFVMSDGTTADAQVEIGSITKVFTALLLADLVLDGTLSPDDTLGELLPDVATDAVRDITLRQLSNHHSGLPRLPANLMPFAALPDPYAQYDEAMLLDFVASVEPERAPDEGFEYSNAAVGLLGYLLGKADGSDYKTALSRRILAPMGLTSTGFEIGETAIKGTTGGAEVSLWTFDALAGAGALRSTVGDMAHFGSILASPPKEWQRHVELLRSEPVSSGGGMTVGLGLFTIPITEGGVLFHNGGTGGFKSSLWADPETGRSVFVNINASDSDPDKLGAWLISGVERAR